MLTFLAALGIVLIVGDFASTFLYHVPQHIWGKLHLRTHHDRTRSYWDHAVISRDPFVLLDGALGAVPYLFVAAAAWQLSPAGAIAGLVLGQFHVWWRHTAELGWSTPAPIARVARFLHIVVPEDHNAHHANPEVEFGDLFRFYDAPARAAIAKVRGATRHRRQVMKRLERRRALRSVGSVQ